MRLEEFKSKTNRFMEKVLTVKNLRITIESESGHILSILSKIKAITILDYQINEAKKSKLFQSNN